MNKTLQYQSKAIYYRCIGSGEPVILIHGFGEDGDVCTGASAVEKNS